MCIFGKLLFAFFKSQYLELLSSKEKSDQRIKDFEGNDEKYENTINRITKENHDLKREIEELKVSNSSVIN